MMKPFSKTLLLLLVCLLVCHEKTVAQKRLKESDISKEQFYNNINVYKKHEKAIDILKELKRRKAYKPYDLSFMEGDLHFDRGNIFEALKYYKRIIFDEDVKNNYNIQKYVTYRMLFCYRIINDMPNFFYQAARLYSLATKSKDSGMLAIATFAKGEEQCIKGNNKKGYELMDNAIEKMKYSNCSDRYDQIYYFYILKSKQQIKDKKYNQSLKTLNSLIQYSENAKDKNGKKLGKLNNLQRKDIYGRYAVVLNKMGRDKEADSCYKHFVELGNEEYYEYDIVKSYLFDRHHYDELIDWAEKRADYLNRTHNISGYFMADTRRIIAEAYMKKGDFLNAAINYAQLDSINQILKKEEQNSALTELSSNYELHDAQIEAQRRITKAHILGFGLAALTILIAATIIVWRTMHYNRIIMAKNRTMAKNIDDLMEYRKQQRKPDSYIKNNNNIAGENKNINDEESQEQIWFERLRHAIVDQQLYLRHDLTRDYLLEEFNIPKNIFSSLFKTYAGTTYNKYINDLRIEHSIELMKQFPNYKIESIATDSGFSSLSTLYKLFSEHFGMTPAEYRKILSKSDCGYENETQKN